MGFIWNRYMLAVVIIHIIGIAALSTVVPTHPTFIGMGIAAYVFGLRHAFDIDHIAAIDNTVRKLVAQKKDPRGVGFYFSFGHSTVVFFTGCINCGIGKVRRQIHVQHAGYRRYHRSCSIGRFPGIFGDYQFNAVYSALEYVPENESRKNKRIGTRKNVRGKGIFHPLLGVAF